MSFLRTLFAIISNTFTETLRQPVYGVIIIATTIILVLGPSLAMFTMDDDNKLLKDVGLSTLLVAGLFLSVFASATVVTGEIENKTVLTVISKTASRTAFVIGKFIGIAVAVILAQYFLSLVLFMVVRHGVLQQASQAHDYVVITLGSVAAGITFLVSVAGNYFYRWRFSTTAISLGTISATLVMVLLFFLDPKWKFDPLENHLAFDLVGPILLIIFSTLILASIAVALATRFGLVTTLSICMATFILGAMIQYLLGPITHENTGLSSYLAWIALTIVPSIHIFVASNAINEGINIPISYLGQTALYACLYVMAVLLFAIALFRTREIS